MVANEYVGNYVSDDIKIIFQKIYNFIRKNVCYSRKK